MKNFETFGLRAELLRSLTQLNFVTPTPVQEAAIPVALAGQDILGTSQTGSGKTGAFTIPLISRLLEDRQAAALIITPTRELATQVMDVVNKMLGQNSGINTAILIGGNPMFLQVKQLRARPRLIVGTPGRINDHLQRGNLRLNQVRFLVLDEMDRMLDMGFGIQIDKIVDHLSTPRQTLMFSATLPPNIQHLAKKYLIDPVRISISATNAPATQIKQETIKLAEQDKYAQLLTEIDQRQGSIIIFMKTKLGAEKMAVKLRAENHAADAIHGDLRQRQRDRAILMFRNRKNRIMVATDIAARGLDIPHIEHVINYDLPQCPEDYIHRIGRTGRAGANGEALSLVTPQDSRKWYAICRLLNLDDGKQQPGNKKKRPFREQRSSKPFHHKKKGPATTANNKGSFSNNRRRAAV